LISLLLLWRLLGGPGARRGDAAGRPAVPGRDPINPLTARQLSRIFHAAKGAARIDKPARLHAPRHCCATHLLEQKVDLRAIRVPLGHRKLNTTAHDAD